MADILGVPDYNPSVDVNFGRLQVAGLQQLGAQLRDDMTQIMANRQAKNLGQQLAQLDPQTKEFPTQLMQAAIQNPLGTLHPVGKMAITTLGAAHKAWEQQNQNAYSSGAGGMIYSKRTGEVVREPTARPSSSGSGEYRMGPRGVVYSQKTGDVLEPDTDLPSLAVAPKSTAPKKATVSDLRFLNKLTDDMLSLQRKVEEERQSVVGGAIGGAVGGNSRLSQLEEDLARAQERVKEATETVRPTATPAAAPLTAAAAPASLPVVRTAADFAALSSGDMFVDPDGVKRRKP